ncbi:MAG: hypothetical protein BWY95_00423 [Bacteroidetes bacterium ADurb.BinA104]|nr:MAG: hypothetical protein BWY95_00423 [Bacteroidetes bacterium ADurb.BinA104]
MSIGSKLVVKDNIGDRCSGIDIAKGILCCSSESVVSFSHVGKNLRSRTASYWDPLVVHVKVLPAAPNGRTNRGFVAVFEMHHHGVIEVCGSDVVCSDRNFTSSRYHKDVVGGIHMHAIDIIDQHLRSTAIHEQGIDVRGEVVTSLVASYGTQIVGSVGFVSFIHQTIVIVVHKVGQRGRSNPVCLLIVSTHVHLSSELNPATDRSSSRLRRILIHHFHDIVHCHQQFVHVCGYGNGIYHGTNALHTTNDCYCSIGSVIIDMNPARGSYLIEEDASIGCQRQSAEFIDTSGDCFGIQRSYPRSHCEIGKSIGIIDDVSGTQQIGYIEVETADDTIIVQIKTILEVITTLSKVGSILPTFVSGIPGHFGNEVTICIQMHARHEGKSIVSGNVFSVEVEFHVRSRRGSNCGNFSPGVVHFVFETNLVYWYVTNVFSNISSEVYPFANDLIIYMTYYLSFHIGNVYHVYDQVYRSLLFCCAENSVESESGRDAIVGSIAFHISTGVY